MIKPKIVDIGKKKVILIENYELDQPKKEYIMALIDVKRETVEILPMYNQQLRRDFSTVFDAARDCIYLVGGHTIAE